MTTTHFTYPGDRDDPRSVTVKTPAVARVVNSICQNGGTIHRIHVDLKAERSKARRRGRDSIMRDMGLTKVRGSLGGTYWE